MKTSLKFPLILLILSVGMIFQTGCKKYEEGPALSLRSKKARVANTWKVEKAELNGTDISDIFEGITYTFEKSGSYTISMGGFTGDSGTWEFVSDKEEIKLTGSDGISSTWKILRLKEKEFWVTEEVGGGTAELHLVE